MDDTVIEVLELPYVAVSTAQRNGVAHRLIEGTSREETVISKRECLATPYVSRRGDGRYTSIRPLACVPLFLTSSRTYTTAKCRTGSC